MCSIDFRYDAYLCTEIHLYLNGFTAPADDNHYYGGMLASRFIAYGIGMFVIAQNPQQHIFWIYNMILIQVIDLLVGVFYTFKGTIKLRSSLFPMFNASLL